jgi:outer membrane lipoprotein-sorting protein
MLPLICALALIAPNVDQLLNDVSSKYQATNTYLIHIVSLQDSLPAATFKQEITVAHAPGGRFFEDLVQPSGPRNHTVWVSDGSTAWLYSEDQKEYVEGPVKQVFNPYGYPSSHDVDVTYQYFDKFRFLKNAHDAEFVKQETLKTTAGPVRCLLVKVQSKKDDPEPWSEILWIDAERHLVLRDDRTERYNVRGNVQQTRMLRIEWEYRKLEGPLDSSLFTFDPPATAKRVPHLSSMPTDGSHPPASLSPQGR